MRKTVLSEIVRQETVCFADKNWPWVARSQAYPEGALAYFNSGKEAGASQPRKHLQILPSRLDGTRTAPLPLREIATEAVQHSDPLEAVELRKLPFQCFAAMLPDGQVLPSSYLPP